MRTTLKIQDTLLEDAKKRALEKRCTVSALVEDALRSCLYSRPPETPAQVSEPWPIYGSGGPQPGVDLRDNPDMLERMDTE